MNDRPQIRKYSRVELERRFTCRRVPPAVGPNDYERLRDLYIDGTHLRLRIIESPSGEFLVGKLGQKVVDPDFPNDPRVRRMTTIYLPESEARVFDVLTGRRSIKRRYRLFEQGWTFIIDQYESPAPAAGLLIAEVECDTLDALSRITLPTWADHEVTADPRFSGATLSATGVDYSTAGD
jgi:CYTH domain-containing protein